MASWKRPIGILLLLSALFCAGAALFWTRWVWAPPPDSWAGMHLMLGAMLLLGLALLGAGVAACTAGLLARKEEPARSAKGRLLAFPR